MEWKKTGCMRLVKKLRCPFFSACDSRLGSCPDLEYAGDLVYRFGIYGICFLLGYYVFSHKK